MALYHRIQPHHHVSIWAVAVLVMLLSATTYTTATLAEEQNYDQGEPSEKTQEFFGGKVKKQTGSTPEECRKESQESAPPGNTSSPIYQPTMTKEEYEKLTEEQKKALPTNSVIVEKYSPTPGEVEPRSTDNMPKEEYEKLTEEQKREFEKKNQEGGSDMFGSPECQKAMIKQIQSEMAEFRDKMKSGEFTAKLDNMLSVITKLRASGLKTLKEAGIDTTAIEALLGPIEEDAKTLKAFFAEMISVMDQFFAITDPKEAFTFMRSSFPHNKMGEIAKVADRMVNKIGELKEKLDAIAEKYETSPSPATSPTASPDEGA